MRPEFEGRSVGFGVGARGLLDSCFRWREPPKLAHGRQGTLEGSWRGVTWTQAGVMLVSWPARRLHWHLTPAIPPKDRLYLVRAESNPGRPRKTSEPCGGRAGSPSTRLER